MNRIKIMGGFFMAMSLLGCSDTATSKKPERSDYVYFMSAKYNACFDIRKDKQFQELKDDLFENDEGKAHYMNEDTMFVKTNISSGAFIFTRTLKSCEIFKD